jgi:hypothetical protein
MRLLILYFIPLFTMSQDPLLNHKLYKVEYGDQLNPTSVEVQSNDSTIALLLDHYGTSTAASDQFSADLPYMIDLTGDGIVGTGDLLVLTNAYENVIYDESTCQNGNVYSCWSSSIKGMQINSILQLQGQPIKMVRTSNPDANWWWYE